MTLQDSVHAFRVPNDYQYQNTAEIRVRAAALYRQERYHESIEAINDGLYKRKSEPDLALLDLRAASYARLGSYSAAVSDGRRMVNGWKTNAMGYIRIGKILQQTSNKQQEALKIYQRGLKQVPRSDSKYKNMQAAHDSLNTILLRTLDFTTILPLEVVEMVFSYLELGTLSKCLGVCKSWKDLLGSCPSLWLELDFSKAKREVLPNFVYKCLGYGQLRVRKVTFKRANLHRNRLVQDILTRCTSLSHLHLETRGFLTSSLRGSFAATKTLSNLHLGVSTQTMPSDVPRLMNSCPNLVNVTFDAVQAISPSMEEVLSGIAPRWNRQEYPNLKSFCLIWAHCNGLHFYEIDVLCPPTRNLRSLKIGSWKGDLYPSFKTLAERRPCLTELELIRVSTIYATSSSLPPTLESLKINIDTTSHNAWPGLFDIQAKSANLVELEITTFASAHDSILDHVRDFLDCSHLSEPPRSLKSLGINSCLTSYHRLIPLLENSRLRDLVHLALPGSQYDDDKIALKIAGNLGSLESLDLSKTHITGIGVKALVQSLPHLRVLRLMECPQIARDAIEFARQKGITVNHSLGTQ